MALQREIWIADIQEILFAQNEFVMSSTDDSGYIGNKTVHIPQSGVATGVVVNRSTLPAALTQRTDTELTYNVDQYTTDPFLVTRLDEAQLSYNKRASLMGLQVAALSDLLALNTAFAWGGVVASCIIRTSGAGDQTALAPGATGNRNAITLADIRAAAKKLDQDFVPSVGRKLLMPVDMYYQLFNDSTVVSSFNMGTVTLPTGVVRYLYGFEIMIRPRVLIYAAGAPPTRKAPTALSALTDCQACIAWHPSFVSRAQGR